MTDFVVLKGKKKGKKNHTPSNSSRRSHLTGIYSLLAGMENASLAFTVNVQLMKAELSWIIFFTHILILKLSFPLWGHKRGCDHCLASLQSSPEACLPQLREKNSSRNSTVA